MVSRLQGSPEPRLDEGVKMETGVNKQKKGTSERDTMNDLANAILKGGGGELSPKFQKKFKKIQEDTDSRVKKMLNIE